MLLVLLALPAGIYVFLRAFGTNEFEVPVYHVDGIQGCGDEGAGHTVYPLLEAETSARIRNAICVVSMLTDSSENDAFPVYLLNLTRVYDALKDYRPIRFLAVVEPGAARGGGVGLFERQRDELIPKPTAWYYAVPKNQKAYRQLIKCSLGFEAVSMRPPYKMVLIDSNGCIRGYYDGLSEEDSDRLILEGKILFDNIENSRERGR